MQYIPRRVIKHVEIHQPSKVVAVVGKFEKVYEDWINMDLEHGIRMSYNPITNMCRLWTYSKEHGFSGADLNPLNIKRLVKQLLVLDGFLAQTGANLAPGKDRFQIRISRRERDSFEKEMTKFKAAVGQKRRRIKKIKQSSTEIDDFIPRKYKY